MGMRHVTRDIVQFPKIRALLPTVSSDPSSTLATKGYVDSSSGGAGVSVAQDGSGTYNGSTDVEIQAAITYAIANSIPKVLIKKGTYTISNTINVNGHLTIEGEGTEFTELQLASSQNKYIMKINSTNSTNQYRNVIRGIKFDGNLANQTGDSGGLISYGGIEGIYENLHFENCYGKGLWLYDVGGGSGAIGHHNRITHCLFDQSESSGGDGIGLYMRNNDENSILASEFQYCKIGAKDETGFNHFTNCAFVDGQIGLEILDCSRTRVVNCMFDLCAQQGIHLKGSFNSVVGCTFYKCSDGSSTYAFLHVDYYGTNSLVSNIFVSENNSTKPLAAIWEQGNAAEDTFGGNLILANQFLSTSGATTLQGSSNWASGALLQVNSNTAGSNLTRVS